MMEDIIMTMKDIIMMMEDFLMMMEDIILVFFTTERWPDGREQNTWGPPYKLANNGNIRYICKYACDTKAHRCTSVTWIWKYMINTEIQMIIN